ncbi:NAD(P)H-quinone oxidoreductase [Candidatus Foliamicus sp.]
MRVVAISEPGGPEVLRIEERPKPVPSSGQVLIRVKAAGVNRPDCMQRQGHYPPPPGAPDWPGLEVSGIIESVGSDVDGLAAGQRVCALVAGGGYAEYCLAYAAHCLPVPDSVSLTEAAAIPETWFTVWTNLIDSGRLAAGNTLLVHGGASGIGCAAIQIGRALGTRVFVTAGSEEKVRFCRQLGAWSGACRRTENWPEAFMEACDGKGADVILCMVGGPYLRDNLRCLSPGGRLVLIAALGGPKTELDLRRIMMARLSITGSTLRPRSIEDKADIARAVQANLWPLLEDGSLRPVIQRCFPLEKAHEAHTMMEANLTQGKLILSVD